MAFSLVFLSLAIALFWFAVRLRRSTGIPWVRIVGNDMGGGNVLEQPLFSHRYGLTGKPDYLLEAQGQLIPVEVKPGRQATEPYESDLMQLAAYCLLVEEALGSTPPYGLLRYAHASFRVDYTPVVHEHILDILDDMRVVLEQDDCPRSHENPHRCRGCGFVAQCDDALV